MMLDALPCCRYAYALAVVNFFLCFFLMFQHCVETVSSMVMRQPSSVFTYEIPELLENILFSKTPCSAWRFENNAVVFNTVLHWPSH